VYALNDRLRVRLNPPMAGKPEIPCGKRLFRQGDKVMQLKNSGDVNNGDVGYITTDMRALCAHYLMLDAFVHHTAAERPFGKPADETEQKNRETAQNNLQKIIEAYKKRFSSFRPTTAELYGKEVGNLVQTVLVAWIQRRNCYVDISKIYKEAAK
jgi:hypothetical protein